MNYLLLPSLEHMALVKIIITLWNQEDIRALILKFDFQLHHYEITAKWQEIENKVIKKVLLLLQPQPFREKMLCAIKPVGNQIYDWMEYNIVEYHLAINLTDKLCWTSYGTVDKKRTAEVLIRDETLDITERYKLACIYCFENEVKELWREMPENDRESFYCEESDKNVQQHALVRFWTYDIMGEVDKIVEFSNETRLDGCSPYKFAFKWAVCCSNKEAAEFFFNKLTIEERDDSLFTDTRYGLFSSDSNKQTVFRFLLSKMNGEQQLKIFRQYAFRFLLCFLHWPWQCFFMEVYHRIRDFLSDSDYYRVLLTIINKEIDGYKDYNYQNLFEKFWVQSPATYKKHVIDVARHCLLSVLLKIRDKKNILLIFKDATAVEKENIIFNREGISICQKLADSQEWDLLAFFISECISTRDKMIIFKDICKKYLACVCIETNMIFFQLLSNLIQQCDINRDIEERNCT